MLTHWHHFNQLLNDVADTAARHTPPSSTGTWSPTLWAAADIHETDEALTLTMDLPGLTSSDIEVTVDDRILTIKGTRSRPEREGATTHRQERRFGRFKRTFRLGRSLDPTGTEATVAEGLLTVTVPKSAESKPVHVQVS